MLRLALTRTSPGSLSGMRFKSAMDSVKDAASSASQGVKNAVGSEEQATSNLKATGVHPTKTEGSRKGAAEPGAMSENTKPGESPSLAADVAKNGPKPGDGPYGAGGQQKDGGHAGSG